MYTLTTFGGVTLPTNGPAMDAGTDERDLGLMRLPGGAVYDPYGTAAVRGGGRALTYRCVAWESSEVTLQTTVDNLRALADAGRGSLVATMPDDSTRWRWARLQSVECDWRPRYYGDLGADLELKFQCLGAGWNGTARAGTTTMAASPATASVVNSGNRRVTDAVVTVTPGTAAITAFDLSVSGQTQLVYSGTIGTAQSLVLDCGAKSVKLAGSSDYAHLALGSNHAIDDWLRLRAGTTSVVATFTGGGTTSKVVFTYADGWE